jgi:ATP/maltotriose-dependent transcriptional regulator MalT
MFDNPIGQAALGLVIGSAIIGIAGVVLPALTRHLVIGWARLMARPLGAAARRRAVAEARSYVYEHFRSSGAGQSPTQLAVALLIQHAFGIPGDLAAFARELVDRHRRAREHDRRRSGQTSFEARREAALLRLREDMVIAGVVKGLSNSEIAAELRVGRRAVEQDLSVIYGRHGVTGRLELALKIGPRFLAPSSSRRGKAPPARRGRERAD